MKRLLASIHDVSPRFEREVDQLLAHLYPHVGERLAMLVVPDHWGAAPLTPAFKARLRAWSDRGVEMFVHGWFHRDTSAHAGTAAFKARHMTAGEGEFLVDLITHRVPAGVDDAAKVKASFLAAVAHGDIAVPLKKKLMTLKDIQGDLFELCRGTAKGRKRKDEITLFKSTGVALEDLAAAMLIWRALGD